MIRRVEIPRQALHSLQLVPRHIANKLRAWVEEVEACGLEQVRRVPGFHDEPLQGKRFGQRSIRLSRSFRAIYRVCADEMGKFVLILEVNKHDY
jgi:toxin HigB-1